MSLLARMRSVLFPSRGKGAERPPQPGSDRLAASGGNEEAFLVFSDTGEVIRAEKRLAKNGIAVRVMGPPPELRTGCDMVLVIPLAEALAATALLEKHERPPLRMSPCGGGMLEPVSLFQVKDYGDWLMVRAANMKVTAEKATGRIVNVSGGGCPDVPWLASLLTGGSVNESAPVNEHGRTLCGYALRLALEELSRQLREVGDV